MPDLTKILELTGPRALGLFIACALLYLANAHGLVPLDQISPSAPAVNGVVGIIAGALALMWIVESIVRWARGLMRRHEVRRIIRGELATLAADEERLLRGMLEQNQRSISLSRIEPVANRLVHRGLFDQASAGTILAWPFTIPDEVWAEMKRRWDTKPPG